MAKDNCNTPEAKKSLDFGSAAATDLQVAETTAEISNHIVASPGIGPRPIQFGAFVPRQIPVQVFIPSNRQNLVQRENIHSDEGLTLETSAFRISVRWPIYIINSVDKTKFFYFSSKSFSWF